MSDEAISIVLEQVILTLYRVQRHDGRLDQAIEILLEVIDEVPIDRIGPDRPL